MHINPITKLEVSYTPNGRFVHVPPNAPRSDWRNDFGPAWWKDSSYCIGSLTKKTRKIRVINTLTKQEHILEVILDNLNYSYDLGLFRRNNI